MCSATSLLVNPRAANKQFVVFTLHGGGFIDLCFLFAQQSQDGHQDTP